LIIKRMWCFLHPLENDPLGGVSLRRNFQLEIRYFYIVSPVFSRKKKKFFSFYGNFAIFAERIL